MSTVVLPPTTGQALLRGSRQLTAALRPTLGPVPRTVAMSTVPSRAPDLLNDAGAIAERLIELPLPADDVGAMFLRGLLSRVASTTGDGVATTSVLFQAVLERGLTAIAAGANAMLLRAALQRGLAVIVAELARQAQPVTSAAQLARVAHTVCPEPALAGHVAHLGWVLGEFGQLTFRPGAPRELASELIEGSYWETALLSQTNLALDGGRRLVVSQPALVLSDLELDDPAALVPAIRAARQAHAGGVIFVARKLTAACLAVLSTNDRPEFRLLAVRTPGLGTVDRHQAALADLAAATGARPLLGASGDQIERITVADLGTARQGWVDRTHLGFIGPGGDAGARLRHVRALRQRHQVSDDLVQQRELAERLGRSTGSTGLLWVNGLTADDTTRREALANRTLAALRAAMQGGVVPGGGAAFLACRPAVATALANGSFESRLAARMLDAALAEPNRAILANAGIDAGVIARAQQPATADEPLGIDPATGQAAALASLAVWDPAPVALAAARTALEGAAQALTIDVVIHRRPG